MNHRVRIGTCSGPAEVAFVRSVFDAHALPVVINGEMHASTMGGLGGFVQLDILVDAEDAEDAVALLRDIRAGDHALSEDDQLPDGAHAASDGDDVPEGPEGDELADAAGMWNAKQHTGAPEISSSVPGPTPVTGFDTRHRRTGVVLLLSVLVGFGTAHMATGAWGRGVVIAAISVAGIAYIVSGHIAEGGWLLFGARFGDLFGALWRVWSQPGSDRTHA